MIRALYRLKASAAVLLYHAKKFALRQVCRIRGHHYDTPCFHWNTLYFCTRCRAEITGRTFDDLEPLTDEDIELLHRFPEGRA